MLSLRDPVKFSLDVIVMVVGLVVISAFVWLRYSNSQVARDVTEVSAEINYADMGSNPLVYEDEHVRFEYPNYWIADLGLTEPYILHMRGVGSVNLDFSKECEGSVLHQGEVSDVVLIVERLDSSSSSRCWEDNVVSRHTLGDATVFEWEDGVEIMGREMAFEYDGGDKLGYVLVMLFADGFEEEAFGVFDSVVLSFGFK